MSVLKSKLIRVSSTKHVGTGQVNHADFKVNLGSEEPAIHRVKKCTLVSCMFNNNHYNVNSSNNTLKYYENGVIQTVVVPVGQYTTNTLLDHLEANTGLVWDQTTLTSRVTVNIGTAINYQLLSVDADPESTLSPFLGITSSTLPAINILTEVDAIPNLNGLDMAMIHSDKLARGNLIDSDRGEYPIVSVVPVEVAFGSNVVFHDTSLDEGTTIVYDSTRNLTSIDVRLTDQDFNTLTLQHEVVLVLKVYY